MRQLRPALRLTTLAAASGLLCMGAAQAQETPRKGGTIRMTAPYGASFGSLDPATTPRAQDDIINKALHRTLYNWDSKDNKLVLELATSATPIAWNIATSSFCSTPSCFATS